MFENRCAAGDRLAGLLEKHRDDPTGLILALPRGGVAVGYRISVALRVPLDVFITRKLGTPGNPELAMGAVAETGTTLFNEDVINALGITQAQLDREVEAQQEEIRRRQVLYRGARALPPIAERTIMLVDDGIATGATLFASVSAVRSLGPARLVGAIPVGPRETIERVRQLVDELVVLEAPELFFAVGNHYADFRQVQDDEVVQYLSLAASALERRAETTQP